MATNIRTTRTDPPRRAGALAAIREIAVADAEAVARLSGELGYPASTAEMQARIRRLADLPDRTAFVASLEETVVAWIDVGIVYHLQSGPYGEIGGLVVASGVRSSGVGRILVSHAEGWVRDRKVYKMVVRSRVTREAAHRFYRREGYQQTKTSAVFFKTLT